MATFTLSALARGVSFEGVRMRIELQDGRELSVPLAWFPTLRDASDANRADWRLIGVGEGLRWESLDEDISVPRLLGLPCD